jgi:hypothetical protein
MAEPIHIARNQFKVSDFLSWKRDGTLRLTPPFQRRSVWKPGAKSYLVDTVLRGLPTPIIFLRERIELKSQRAIREVVDGQQRLRTLIGFVDEDALDDFEPDRDRFTVRRSHNPDVSGQPFSEFSNEDQLQILGYEFSTHTLPAVMDDRAVLQMFARLNSTGERLNGQELRNANYFGVCKTLMYQLGYEQLERWREWGIFSEDDLSRMLEVEFASDASLNMLEGITAKRQSRLDRFYKDYDDELPGARTLARRFAQVMDAIDDQLGNSIVDTVYRSDVNFFTLFVYIYDQMFSLGSPLKRSKANPLPRGLKGKLLTVSDRIRTEQVPKSVLDAIQRASADVGRRRTRLRFMASVCDA